MSKLAPLIASVAVARQEFIVAVSGLSHEQAQFRPSATEWSVIDITEHMFWAEFGAINGIWKIIDDIKAGNPLKEYALIHEGLSIERVIEKTWREKEEVPETAKPRWGGNLQYWIYSLESCQGLLLEMNKALGPIDPAMIIHPHPISGAINLLQRIEFLRFHLNRHQQQVEHIKSHPDFPGIRQISS